MAEALLRARLADRAPEVTVGSAGLRFQGRPADHHAAKAMAKRDLSLDGFSSQILSADLLSGASLILGMERFHVREVALLAEGLLDLTFTLPEFVEKAEAAGPRGSESLAQWVTGVGQGRDTLQYLTPDPAAEVADPMGQSMRAFRACADRLDDLIARLVELAWPPAEPVGQSLSPQPGGIHADRDRL